MFCNLAHDLQKGFVVVVGRFPRWGVLLDWRQLGSEDFDGRAFCFLAVFGCVAEKTPGTFDRDTKISNYERRFLGPLSVLKDDFPGFQTEGHCRATPPPHLNIFVVLRAICMHLCTDACVNYLCKISGERAGLFGGLSRVVVFGLLAERGIGFSTVQLEHISNCLADLESLGCLPCDGPELAYG